MKTIPGIVRIAAGALLLLGFAAGARAEDCHQVVAGGHYECVGQGELETFTVDFNADGRTVSFKGDTLAWFCSSSGTLTRPGIEAGLGITCVRSKDTSAFTLSARARWNTLSQGTTASVALDGRELFPFFCTRSPVL